MKFKDKNIAGISLGNGKVGFVGRATLAEIKRGLRDQCHTIYTAYDVNFPEPNARIPKIKAGVSVDEMKLAVFGHHGVAELDIFFWPSDLELDDESKEKLLKELERRRTTANDPNKYYAGTIRWHAIEVYKRCVDLVSTLNGKEISADRVDPEILKTVASLGEAIQELREDILHAIADLIDGKGQILTALEEALGEITKPSEAEVKDSLGFGITLVRVANWFRKIVKSGALSFGYGDVHPFYGIDIERFFMAGLLGEIGKWGGKPEEGYEIRSVYIISILRANGCELPNGLEELVLNQNRIWPTRYTYKVEVVIYAGPERAEEDNKVCNVQFRGRETFRLERIIKQEVEEHAFFFAEALSLSGGKPEKPTVNVEIVPNIFVASVLIMSLTGYYRRQIKTNKLGGLVMYEMISTNLVTCLGYKIVSNRQQNLPMISYVLAAIANTFNILLPGFLVELRDPSAGSSPERRELAVEASLNGSLGVVTTVKINDENSPYMTLVVNSRGWIPYSLQKSVGLGSVLHGALYAQNRRIVVGIVTPKVLFEAENYIKK